MRYFVLHDRAFFFPIFCLCRFIFAVNRLQSKLDIRLSPAFFVNVFIQCGLMCFFLNPMLSILNESLLDISTLQTFD